MCSEDTSAAEPDKNDDEIERLKLVVDIWKYVVSVQMHFNDMEMKIRNLYVTVIAASFGLTGALYGKYVEIWRGHISVALPIFVMIAVIFVSLLFYFVDRHWYHRLLHASVQQCGFIEDKYKVELPEIALGSKISAGSPVDFAGRFWRFAFFFVSDPRFKATGKIHSDAKIEILYKSAVWIALISAVAYGIVDGVHWKGCSLLSSTLGTECYDPPVRPLILPAKLGQLDPN